MRKLFGTVLALVLVSGIASATLVTVVVPDPSPLPYIFYGNGDASVTYSGVMFNQFLALGNANLFDVGPLFSGGDPAVLSSQEATMGVENILITFPNPTTFLSIDYGTFNGSAVTFALSNGQTFTQGSTGSGYLTPDFFSFSGAALTSVEITSPDFVMNINNISYNSGTTVPEPGTLVMLGSGIIGLAGVLRRKINL